MLSERETWIILLGAIVALFLAGAILSLFLSVRRARIARDRLADTVIEVRTVESELRESEQRFRDFTDSASDWYWETGPDLRYTLLFPINLKG